MVNEVASLRALSRDEVRAIDQIAVNQYLMPSICLMENAGRGAAKQIADHLTGKRACILCGPGNNGGDGFVIARHLELLGWNVAIWLLSEADRMSGDAAINYRVAVSAQMKIQAMYDATEEELRKSLTGFDCIVDAMLGTGARGNPRGVFAYAIRAANAQGAVRVAIDLPSGLDCDTGLPNDPCFQANRTITFVARKQGFDSVEAQRYTGKIDVASIGVPADLLRQFENHL